MRSPSSSDRQRLLAAAFDQGVRHFDVARMYGLGAAEAELGRFALRNRGAIVIATKFGIEAASDRLARVQGPIRALIRRYPALRSAVKRHSGTVHRNRRYDAATARMSLEKSLRELRTDYVDILFLHDPSPADDIDLPGVTAYLEEARQAGYLRAWGIAGEHHPCVEIRGRLPRGAVLQVRDDIFRPSLSRDGLSKPLITYGALSPAIRMIQHHVAMAPETGKRWATATGQDCTSSETLASMLLRDALSFNSDGVVLLSTTRLDHLEGIGQLTLASDVNPASLESFRRLVETELGGA